MRKYGMLVLVLVLSVTSLLAAAAYNTATVSNYASLRINNTDEALLALIPGTGVGNKDMTAYLLNGSLMFNFGRGAVDTPGIQRFSEYEWANLFSVKNNSLEKIDVTVAIPAPLIGKVWVAPAAGPGSYSITATVHGLASGATTGFKFKVIGDGLMNGIYDGPTSWITVSAVAVP